MKLTDLIEKGELKTVLDILGEKSRGLDSDFVKDVVIQQQRLNTYLRNKRLELEAPNTLEIERNRLSDCIYDLVQEFEYKYGEIEVQENLISQSIKIEQTPKEIAKELPTPRRSFCLLRLFVILLFLSGVIGFVWLIVNIISDTSFSKVNLSNINETIQQDDVIKLPPIKTLTEIGFDKNLKAVHIKIDILDSKFTWKKGDIVVGESVYEGKIVDLKVYFRDQFYVDKINKALDIICLGNASFEESLNIPEKNRKSEEETRASIRATHLSDIIKELKINDNLNIYALNLGKYSISSPPSSDYQRSIVIIRVINKDEGVNLNDAIIDVLTRQKDIPFDVQNFSLVQDDKIELK